MKLYFLFLPFILNSVTNAESTKAKRLLPGVISTEKNEINFQLTDDEKQVIFTRSQADYSQGKIHLLVMDKEEIIENKQIIFSDTRYKDSDPWLSADGQTLYFISNRPAFDGDIKSHHNDYDIWRSKKSGDHWLTPEHLSLLNSTAGEFGPELNNGNLYFSSKKEGVYNIYKSKLNGQEMGPPEKLKAPFNTEFHDSDFTLSRDGHIAIWWSTRPGGYGSGDLYVSRLHDNKWTIPENLGADINSIGLDFTPSLSPNHAKLYFSSNKAFPGQDKGASDIYEIDVMDVPVLKTAMIENTKTKLLNAFGGKELLQSINTFSYEFSHVSKPKPQPAIKQIIIDFRENSIKEIDSTNSQIKFASNNSGYVVLNNENKQLLNEEERDRFIQSIKYNFIYYLRADDFSLDGPLDIIGHGNLLWFKLTAGNDISNFSVGIDPMNGRIVKVLTNSNQIVLEQGYEKHSNGLIWPKRYVIPKDDGHLIGQYSNVRLNKK